MNKAELTEALAAKAEIPKQKAASYVNSMLTIIVEALEGGDKVTLSDFGTFTVSQRRAFKGHDPRTGKELAVPSRRIPVFRAGKGLKEALNKG